MSSSILYRRVPGLMVVCTLLLSSLLFSGCSLLVKLFDEKENKAHRPAMVILANDVTEDGTSVLIDIDKITIGAVALSDLMEMADKWRVNIFTWKGDPIGKYAEYISTEKRTIMVLIPKNKMGMLLRGDMDLILKGTTNGAGAKEVTKSFGFLVYNDPDLSSLQRE